MDVSYHCRGCNLYTSEATRRGFGWATVWVESEAEQEGEYVRLCPHCHLQAYRDASKTTKNEEWRDPKEYRVDCMTFRDELHRELMYKATRGIE